NRCERRNRDGCRSRTAEKCDELASFHYPMSPVRPTERIAHLGTADCCIHPPGRSEMIARAADNFFQGGKPKTGHPISPPRPPHRQKSFLTKFAGMAPG